METEALTVRHEQITCTPARRKTCPTVPISTTFDGVAEPVDADLVRQCVARILDSSFFSGSARMRSFLRFVVERTLSGAGAGLKEYVLGIEIFGRKDLFDPRVDAVVRVEARRLRLRLRAYYESEGSLDPMVIELPTGSYMPRFRRAHTAASR